MIPDLPSLRGIHPRKYGLASWTDHVPFAFDLVAQFRPQCIVELGAHSSESYFAFCQSAQESGTGTICYAVDTWKGDAQAGFYADGVYEQVVRHNAQYYASFSYLIRATFDEAVAQFQDGTIDLLHIDGLHTYAAVRHDFETWRPKLRPGAIVLFHDIVSRHDDFGVWKLWDELSAAGGCFAFHHGWGLGVWRAPDAAPLEGSFFQALFSSRPEDAVAVRRYYERASESLRLNRKLEQFRQLTPEPLTALDGDEQGDEMQLQVYFPRRDEYLENSSGRLMLEPDRWMDVALPIPSDWAGGTLRIDPVGGPGLIDLASVRVMSAIMDAPVWKCEGRELIEGVRVAGTARRVAGSRLLRVLSFGRDPQFFLPPIPAGESDIGLRLEMRIRVRRGWPALVGPLRAWTEALQGHAEWTAEKKATEAALAAAQAEAGELRRALDAAREELAKVSAQRAEALTTLSAAQEALSLAHTEAAQSSERALNLSVAAAEAELLAEDRQVEIEILRERVIRLDAEEAGLNRELTAAQERSAAAQKRFAAFQEDSRNLRADLESARAEAESLRAELDSRSGELAKVQGLWITDQNRLRNMRRALSWRLTMPFRGLYRALFRRAPTGSYPAPAVSSHQVNGAVHNRRPATPVAAATAAAEPAPEDPAPAGANWRLQIDEPADWRLPGGGVRVKGWCVPEREGCAPIVSVRLRESNDRVSAGFYGLPRRDVTAALGLSPTWDRCGFEVLLEGLPPGPSCLILEGVQGDGRCVTLGEFHARVPYAAGAAANGHAETDDGYSEWVRKYDTLTAEQRRRIRMAAAGLPVQPLISVLLPTYNTPESWLDKAIKSVRRQLYPRWELCIADDASTEPHVRATIERHAAADARIKVCVRPANGHISAASNSALALAEGAFVALLDHDDELAPHALYTIARELNLHPETELLYSDEDKIDEQGRRFSPHFKPDWNPDLLLGQNYLCHLVTYRTERVRALGGFRVGLEGCQDWDLALRVVEQVPAGHIRHLPRVLYHWRAIAGSTALDLGEKSYVPKRAARALREHCERVGKNAVLSPVPGGHWRLRYALPMPAPLISIIIPTRNHLPVLRRCVESVLARSTYPNFEILIVDNQSDDPETLAWLAAPADERIRVLRYDHPFNFSAINNFAVEHARGELVCLLNNDVEVLTANWLEEMASHAARPEIGAVGAMLYYPNNTIQHAGVVLGVGGLHGIGGVAGHAFKTFPRRTRVQFNRARLVQNYTAVTGACLMIRRRTFVEAGGLNEKNLPIGFNDIDFCLRVYEAGYRNLWTPFAELYHHESVSRGPEDTPAKQQRFQAEVEYMRERWGHLLDQDPAYNPNLTLVSEDFSLAWPPRTGEPAPDAADAPVHAAA